MQCQMIIIIGGLGPLIVKSLKPTEFVVLLTLRPMCSNKGDKH